MELQNFNLNLTPKKNSEKQNYQVVCAHSVSKNAFLILGDFTTEKIKGKNSVKINNVNFSIKYLNNDNKYIIIKDTEFILKDNKGLPGIKFCLDLSEKPIYVARPLIIERDHEIELGGDGKLRFHLDFSDDCDNGLINVGGWPCLTAYVF